MRWALSFALVSLIAPASAFADEPPPSELDALVTTLDDAVAGLDTSDCAVACQALESMIRSADRICELDPGPPCTDARAKVDAARQKVLAACPDCTAAAAGATSKKPRRHDANEAKPGTQPEPVEEQERLIEAQRETGAEAPPAEDAHGGCASCATIGSARAAIDPGWGLLLGGALLALRRRRLSSSSRASDRA